MKQQNLDEKQVHVCERQFICYETEQKKKSNCIYNQVFKLITLTLYDLQYSLLTVCKQQVYLDKKIFSSLSACRCCVRFCQNNVSKYSPFINYYVTTRDCSSTQHGFYVLHHNICDCLSTQHGYALH